MVFCPGDADKVRGLFERAVQVVGDDWDAGAIWGRYVAWEEGRGEIARAANVAMRAATAPCDFSRGFCGILQRVR